MLKNFNRLTTTEPSDEELVSKTLAGDLGNYTELVNRYAHRLFNFLMPRMRSVEDTEDIVQETFLKAYMNLARYKSKCRFSTWLFTIATRLAISQHRKKQTLHIPPASEQDTQDPFEILVLEEERENIWMLARSLKEDQYNALWLRYVEDMSIDEISRILKKTRIHIKVLLHRGRNKLAKRITSKERTRDIQPAAELETVVSCGQG